MSDDRQWLFLPQLIADTWTTPHLTVTFGHYWKLYAGCGPFYLTVGYGEQF